MNGNDTSNQTVLLVDDEELVLILGRRIFERLGYQVKATDNCKEALDIVCSEELDIPFSILDVVMPEMDGPELARILWEKRPDLKVLFSSGYGLNDQIRKLIDAGKADYLDKPFTREDIVEKIRTILGS